MNVALVDWHWVGHHPTYFPRFAAGLAAAGAEVVPCCPEPGEFTAALGRLALDEAVARRIQPPELLRLRARFLRVLPRRLHGLARACGMFGGLGQGLRSWERRHGRRIDLVFFACIYDWDFRHFRRTEALFRFPWSGLYLHARGLRLPGSPLPYGSQVPRPEHVFRSRRLRSVALLDEGVLDRMRGITGTDHVVHFPDITDGRLPAAGSPEGRPADALRAFARGRPIVTLAGYLQKTKGVEEFTALAQTPRMRDRVFCLAGEPALDGFAPAARARLREIWGRIPNLWTHLQRMPDDPEMNAILAASDVVFAAYRDFPNSSNLLTKAAVFRKPVLVSDGHLMAERVRRFGLGEIAPEGDLPALEEALHAMLSPGYGSRRAAAARWEEYATEHAAERLPERFAAILARA